MSQGGLTVGASALPAQPTALLGRELELAAARDRLLQAEVRLLTFTGPGGTGKTRLALAAAAEAQDEFERGAAFVDLSALADPALLGASILQALDVQTVGQPLEDALLLALRHRHQLLVLDNLEHLLAAAPLLAEVLAACPKLKLLVTSRIPLHLRWEHEFPVPPLALPDLARLPPPADLARVPAVALFVRRAKAALPDFALTADNARAVAAICVRLDGLPLALELAAPRLKLYSPEALLMRLEQRLDLAGGPLDLPARQRDLRSEIQWSYDLLSQDEQRAFRGLGVFAGGFELGAAAAVWGEGADAEALLASLLEQNMVQRQAAAQDPAVQERARFRLLETLRAFALERLAEHITEKAQVEERHGYHYLHFLQGYGKAVRSDRQQEALSAINVEFENIRKAWQWAVDTAKPRELAQSVAVFYTFHEMSGRYREGIASLEQALGALSSAEYRAALGQVLVGQAWLYKGWGNYDHAAELARRSLEILRPLREWQGVIVALSTLAYGLFSKGSFSEAGLRWKEALAIAEEARDPLATANLTAHLGMAEIWLGNYSEAEHHSHRALSLARQLGDRALEVFALLNLGNAKTFAGALQEGQAVYEEGLRVAREIGYRRFIPHLLYCLGWSTLGLGNHLEARGLCQEALTLARESGDVHAQCFALMNLGAALLALGDHAGAEAHLTESLLAAWKTRNTSLVVSSLAPLAELRIKQEQHEQALRLLNTVLRHPASGAWVKQYAVVLGAKLDAHLSPGETLEPGDCEQLRAVLEELLGQSLAELPTPFDQIVPVRASSLEPDPLTERERQVLRLIATGLPNKAIAKRLGISEKTVSRHLENIFVKLDVSSRSAATAYAVRVGIT